MLQRNSATQSHTENWLTWLESSTLHTNSLLIDNSSTYFSTTSILDLFFSEGNSQKPHFKLINNFLKDSNVFAPNETYLFLSENFNLSNYNYFNFEADRLPLELSEPLFSLSTNIVNICNVKNDVVGLLDFIPQYADEIQAFDLDALEADTSLLDEITTPDTKMYYPEPFIASPSFVHEDLWFIHILHFAHWLWFMFISLIYFYFITFINVVRYCNLRNKPKRETRGVSRSKCADLITACVPVSWAAAIIISETVDATDYYDGFGTGEIVVGIRAYQWGWEYFYPKGIDLSYNVTPSYSSVIGNSLKYSNCSSFSLNSGTLWKYFQSKNSLNSTSTPAHLLLSPSDDSKAINFMNFSQLGINSLKEQSAFKKIQFFSKSNPHDLFNSKSDFEFSYNKVMSLYNSDFMLQNASAYGTLRQHNTSSLKSTINLSNSLLDTTNFNNYLSYTNPVKNLESLNRSNETLLNFSNFFQQYNLDGSSSNRNKFNISPVKNTLLGEKEGSKQFSNPFKFLINNRTPKKITNSLPVLNLNNVSSEFTTLKPSNTLILSLTNLLTENKFLDPKSNNLQLLPSERNSRLLSKVHLSKNNYNLGNSKNNLTFFKNLNTSLEGLFNSSTCFWQNSDITSKVLNNNTYMPNSHSPVMSSNIKFYAQSYDRFTASNEDQTPAMLRSKEEAAPNHVFNSYWLHLWLHSSDKSRYSNALNVIDAKKFFYLPLCSDYAEYDFRNWQAAEMLEDLFWESTYSSFSHEDYNLILQDSKDYNSYQKQEELFNLTQRVSTTRSIKSGSVLTPFFKDLNLGENYSALPLFSEEALVDTNLLNLKNFNPFSTEVVLDSMEDPFDFLKSVKYLYSANSKALFSKNLNFTQPLPYTQVMDIFRADYEDNFWSVDSTNSEHKNLLINNLDTEYRDLRTSNQLKLRSTTKNAMVTYNAIQKVFKSRFDEGRSNARLQDFSNSFVKHPLISEKRTNFESLLGKNKETFMVTNLYNQFLKLNNSSVANITNTMSIYFTEIPFLLSMKSDASRYLWFDWQSRWSSLEIQPSSVSRYSLLGVPYSNKSFEYTTQLGDEVNDSSDYLTKLSKARKNYLSNWSYTPYFYAKVSNWYKASMFFDTLFLEPKLANLKILLKTSNPYWTLTNMNNLSHLSSTSISGINTPGRSSWKPLTGSASYTYSVSTLVDLLSKREYLYRRYYTSRGLTTLLPKFVLASPTNTLLTEVKRVFPLTDPINFSSEFSREFFYQNTNFTKFILLKDFLRFSNEALGGSLNLSSINNYLFFYLFSTNHGTKNSSNLDLYKNQFRPMRKGVSNMIRLHATGAIAMPIEIRLHILASSKDVIHSWSIPSAGIKIDCVPGYSSHRITIFLVSGIFWGQCMEICGRFHHWMPIIVYFMKRDLFFLWCTHFMHYTNIEHTFNMADKQLSDRIRVASFDSTTWVHELNKIL